MRVAEIWPAQKITEAGKIRVLQRSRIAPRTVYEINCSRFFGAVRISSGQPLGSGKPFQPSGSAPCSPAFSGSGHPPIQRKNHQISRGRASGGSRSRPRCSVFIGNPPSRARHRQLHCWEVPATESPYTWRLLQGRALGKTSAGRGSLTLALSPRARLQPLGSGKPRKVPPDLVSNVFSYLRVKREIDPAVREFWWEGLSVQLRQLLSR